MKERPWSGEASARPAALRWVAEAMLYTGACPHCGARLEFAAPPAPLVACPSCSRNAIVTVPEHPDEAGEVQIIVLPRQETPVLEGALERHGLRRPVLLAVLAGVALAVLLLATGGAYLVAPESGLAMTLGETSALGILWLVLGLPTAAALALLVVRLLFRRERRVQGLALGRSVVAVVAGVATLVAAGIAVNALRTLAVERVPDSIAYWSVSVLCDAGVAVLAGLVTVRLAPVFPYRHAASVGIVVVLLVALLALAFVPIVWYAPVVALVFLALLPPLLLGAWLGVRLRWTGACAA